MTPLIKQNASIEVVAKVAAAEAAQATADAAQVVANECQMEADKVTEAVKDEHTVHPVHQALDATKSAINFIQSRNQ